MDFDIAIIGAGPAGLSAAYACASTGAKVAVFEKSKEIGYPIRTSGATWVTEMEKLKIPTHLYHPFKRSLFFSNNERATFEYDMPKACILDVRGFYQHLALECSLKGAKIYLGTTVKEPLIEDDFVVGCKISSYYYNETIKSKIVIDASGFSSVCSRRLGLFSGYKRTGIGAEYDLVAPKWDQEEAALFFGSKYVEKGYAWIFPRGNSRIRLGIGMIHPDTKKDPREFLENMFNASEWLNERLSSHSQIEFHTGVVPSELYKGKTYHNGLIIVGDAAGHVSLFAGEGIRFAIDNGKLAGEIAAAALKKGSLDKGFLRKYETAWKKKYETQFKIAYKINKKMSEMTDLKWDQIINLLSQLAPELVAELMRANFNAKFFLKFLASRFPFSIANLRLLIKLLHKKT